MGTLHIVSENIPAAALDALVMDRRRRPRAVMEDYSFMALRVDRLSDSARALRENRHPVSPTAGGIAVTFSGVERLGDILGVLTAGNIRWHMADIVDGVYQG